MRARILNAAKEQFADHGFEGASIRAITDRAGVNPAMLGYHFGSKDHLFKAVVRDILKDITASRLKSFALLEERHPEKIPADLLIRAYVQPILDVGGPLERDASVYLRIYGRLYTEPSDIVARIIANQFTDISNLFVTRMHESLGLTDINPVIFFRHQMMMGALGVVGMLMRTPELHDAEFARLEGAVDRFCQDWAAIFAQP